MTTYQPHSIGHSLEQYLRSRELVLSNPSTKPFKPLYSHDYLRPHRRLVNESPYGDLTFRKYTNKRGD